jgi:hypothetical protein
VGAVEIITVGVGAVTILMDGVALDFTTGFSILNISRITPGYFSSLRSNKMFKGSGPAIRDVSPCRIGELAIVPRVNVSGAVFGFSPVR